MGYYFLFCSCQKARPSLTDNHIKRGTKKRGLGTLRKNYIRENVFIIEETWEFSWGDEFENNVDKKNHIGKIIFSKDPFLLVHYCKKLKTKQSSATCDAI